MALGAIIMWGQPYTPTSINRSPHRSPGRPPGLFSTQNIRASQAGREASILGRTRGPYLDMGGPLNGL